MEEIKSSLELLLLYFHSVFVLTVFECELQWQMFHFWSNCSFKLHLSCIVFTSVTARAATLLFPEGKWLWYGPRVSWNSSHCLSGQRVLESWSMQQKLFPQGPAKENKQGSEAYACCKNNILVTSDHFSGYKRLCLINCRRPVYGTPNFTSIYYH